MPDVINLRQARKRRDRAEKERLAEQNRFLHGRTKAEKTKDRKMAERDLRFIDGHKRERLQENAGPDSGGEE